MSKVTDELESLIPDGDGHNSEYSRTLQNAIIYIMILEKDAKRIDWLASTDQDVGNVTLPSECVFDNVGSLRDAIDCAMAM